MNALVSLKLVSRTYRTGTVAVTALRRVSFDINPGERIAIMGPSGSGKSTLMNLIGLLDSPTEGQICLDGVDVSEIPENDRSRLRSHKIGFVFQSYNLLPRYTAIENVSLPLIYRGLRRQERVQRAEQALERVGMVHRARHLPTQLSGGEQQRIAIARALVGNPTIILADEPTGALDSHTGAEILALFRGLNRRGQTVVLITHDSNVAAQCKRTIRLFDGELVADEIFLPNVPRNRRIVS